MNVMQPKRLIFLCLMLCTMLCVNAPAVWAEDRPISDIHLVLSSLARGGTWWGVTEVYVWDEEGELVTPLRIDAKRRRDTPNNFDRATGALHVSRINDRLQRTGWAPKAGGRYYDNTLGAATLNIRLPREIRGGLLAVETWSPAKKIGAGKTSAGIKSGRVFFRYGGPTTFHDFRRTRNPGTPGSPDAEFFNATTFGSAVKR